MQVEQVWEGRSGREEQHPILDMLSWRYITVIQVELLSRQTDIQISSSGE